MANIIRAEDVMDTAAKQGHVEVVAQLLAIDPTFVARPASWRSAINGQDEVLNLCFHKIALWQSKRREKLR